MGVEHADFGNEVVADKATQCIEMLAGNMKHAVKTNQGEQVRRGVAYPQQVRVVEAVYRLCRGDEVKGEGLLDFEVAVIGAVGLPCLFRGL